MQLSASQKVSPYVIGIRALKRIASARNMSMAMAEGHQDGLIEPSDVAKALKVAIEEDRFMVLSHPVVGEYFKSKVITSLQPKELICHVLILQEKSF